MEKPKTAEEILSEVHKKHMGDRIPLNPVLIEIEAMRTYARQVAEAVRDECTKIAMEEPEASLEILKINIDDYLK